MVRRVLAEKDFHAGMMFILFIKISVNVLLTFHDSIVYLTVASITLTDSIFLMTVEAHTNFIVLTKKIVWYCYLIALPYNTVYSSVVIFSSCVC